MGLSVASLRPISGISYTASTPMNYAVDNEAELSSAFTESVKATSGAASVKGTAPVIYPNAKEVEVGRVAQMNAAKEVGKAYNTIADSFSDNPTGYTSGSQAVSYGTVGSQFDMFA